MPTLRASCLLQSTIKHGEHVQVAEWASDTESLELFVRERKLEGIVAKRSDSLYLPGTRSGSWVKVRFNNRQEFVIGGYTSHLGSTPCWLGSTRAENCASLAACVRVSFLGHVERYTTRLRPGDPELSVHELA